MIHTSLTDGVPMVEMDAIYRGAMHCELTHGPSRRQIETDAPKDNLGLGESFSPTDLVGAALASCALTTMAVVAKKENLPVSLQGVTAKIVKEMNASPRRIARLPLEISFPTAFPAEVRARLEQAAETCPVKLSLSADVQAPITFRYLT